MKTLLEVASPIKEKQSRKVSKKKKKESNGYGALAMTMRGTKSKESLRSEAPFHLIETLKPASTDPYVLEGPIVKCVLITAGLGNRKDLNYYSPEAIQNGSALFEGKPCFLDHMAESETVDRPERSVKEKCGYFKNVHVESIDGSTGLIGELHFDLSESGRMAYAKALTAIHYKSEFPTLESEYVGLSINANGLREKRTIQVGDETLEVNYVTEFTSVGSIDEVTTPARGGRFLAALVESAAGAILQRKDKQTMIVKSLKAALTALTEALKDEKLSEETRKHLLEAQKSQTALLKEAQKAAAEESKEEEAESEDESETESKMESEDEDEDDAHDGVKPGHKVTKTVTVKHDKTDDGEDDAQESKRGYIKSLLKEAGIPKKVWNVDRLVKLDLKEAKAEIAEKKAFLEAVKDAVEEHDGIVPVGDSAGSFSESDDEPKNMNGVFAGLAE